MRVKVAGSSIFFGANSITIGLRLQSLGYFFCFLISGWRISGFRIGGLRQARAPKVAALSLKKTKKNALRVFRLRPRAVGVDRYVAAVNAGFGQPKKFSEFEVI